MKEDMRAPPQEGEPPAAGASAKERPILFSAPMVRAILEGRKTVTRRIVKPQPVGGDSIIEKPLNLGWLVGQLRDSENAWRDLRCPYGQPGDRLWVRERMRVLDICAPTGVQAIRVQYEADKATSDWILWPERLKGHPQACKCLPYGGYREASRLSMEITGNKVERLQGITEEEAVAEGVEGWDEPTGGDDYQDYWRNYLMTPDEADKGCTHFAGDPIASFRSLWESINGPGSWEANPWVWAVSFKRLQAEGPLKAESNPLPEEIPTP